ncbi:hypothetical protein CA600_06435 [Paenibacillus sp. VTT E-133280]|uniref:P-loop NTPase fold protein n=1 Tax=Paenibacillus sp. VTT E-133280 TaxID=1986222 RepID=UPI000BA16938|nr:P-loop NTPase fold protein [Paenibacillus sp. VTT E-133280]OZQ68445.1 hypothetical protein CA600_06435 [Paenibacillus sp. VTT E-133280]
MYNEAKAQLPSNNTNIKLNNDSGWLSIKDERINYPDLVLIDPFNKEGIDHSDIVSFCNQLIARNIPFLLWYGQTHGKLERRNKIIEDLNLPYIELTDNVGGSRNLANTGVFISGSEIERYIDVIVNKLSFLNQISGWKIEGYYSRPKMEVVMNSIQETYIINSIKEYINWKKSDYAVLINGAWGSGKTFFWNNVIVPEIEKLWIDESKDKKYKTIYISLYGINSIEELNKKLSYEIFASMLPKRNNLNKSNENESNGNKYTEIIKTIFSTGLEVTKGLSIFGLEIENLKSGAQEAISNFDSVRGGYVYCFDDMERSNIPFNEIMGYLNNFVEHDNAKIIILCNEEEITKRSTTHNKELKVLAATNLIDKHGDQTKEKYYEEVENYIQNFDDVNYGVIKEKLVGKTLKFESSLQIIFEKIANNIKDDEFKKILANKDSFIFKIVEISKLTNIRIFKQALIDVENLYIKIKNKYIDLSFEPMLIFCFAYSIEYKLYPKKYTTFKEIEDDKEFESLLLQNDQQCCQFRNKYFKNFNYGYNNIFFKFIEKYVREGILDEVKYSVEMDKYIERIKSKEINAYEKILSDTFINLQDEEFSSMVNATFTIVKSGRLPLYRYLHAFLMYNDFRTLNLISMSENEIYDGFMLGLKGIESSDIPSDINIMMSNELKARLNKFDSESSHCNSDHYKKIKLEIIRISEVQFHKRARKKSIKFFEKLFNVSDISFDIFYNEYGNVPFLENDDIKVFFNYIINLKNIRINELISALRIRYQENEKLLEVEREPLKYLNDLITRYTFDKETTLSIYLLNNFKKMLTELSIKDL